MARGRPPKYDIEYIIETMDRYIEETELPIFKEVCYLNNWNTKYIYELGSKNEELSDTIKKLSDKKEVVLERGGLIGKYNPTMVVFSLKQLGWKDKQEDAKDEKVDEDKTIKIEVVNNGKSSS